MHIVKMVITLIRDNVNKLALKGYNYVSRKITLLKKEQQH